jgi:branched-chain amino acid transport system substrate-binding protein
MLEGSEMARDEINAAGGVNVSGVFRDIELITGNEYSYPTIDPTSAALEVASMIASGAQFIVGGFRTECTVPMIEVAMDAGVPFLINGAATGFIVNDTVVGDYARYKYLFRVNPVNDTMLVRTIAGYVAGYLIPYKLLPMYGDPVKVSVITEDLAWTNTIHYMFTNPAIYPTLLGPNALVVHDARLYGASPAVLAATMADVIASEARLMIHIFSGLDGATLIGAWYAAGVQAIPVGINVLAQLQTFWGDTGGACQYEALLNFVGTRTVIVPGLTDVFWDNFVAYSGVWPIYTAFGAYDAIYMLKEAIEAAGTDDPNALVPVLEGTVRQALTGTFKFTSSHDVFSFEYGPTWPIGFTRALVVQWVAEGGGGEMDVVSPIDQLYSSKTLLPPWMYPSGYEALGQADVNFDGTVDIFDVVTVGLSFGAVPGDGNWNIEADLNSDKVIDIFDIVLVALVFGLTAPVWPLP